MQFTLPPATVVTYCEAFTHIKKGYKLKRDILYSNTQMNKIAKIKAMKQRETVETTK